MSMNMYMLNLANGVEALTAEVHENDNELLSIEGSITQIETNLNTIDTNKQDKLGVLSNLSINRMNCSQLFIGSSNINTEIEAIKTSIVNTDYIDNSIAASKAESDAYTDSEILSSKAFIASEVASVNKLTDTKIATTKSDSIAYTDAQVATNKTESTAYTDSKFANVNFSFVNDYIANPTVDLAGKIVSDLSIMNKSYIDAKVQQIWNSFNNYTGKTDNSLKGIHTVDLTEFDSFTQTILKRTTVKIAQFRYTPLNAKSRHNMFFNTPYRFPAGNASGSDEIRSYAKVYQDGTMKYQSYQPIQYFVGATGGGTRSGVIFPLQFSVKPQLLDGKEITIEIYIRNDSDDTVQVESTEGTWFTCTEIKGV